MFCSICGKDCGDYQYCPYCGNEIVVPKSQKEHKESVWSVGQPCPYCGGTKFEKGKCLFCDTQLAEEHIEEQIDDEKTQGDNSVTDYNAYFRRFNPDRLRAIKELRRDTGMSLAEAKKIIDEVFDRNLGREHSDELSNAWENLKNSVRVFRKNKKK